MDRQDRKAAVAAYRERKVESGVFAVRCTPTGATWVGTAPDLSTIRNRLWFTLGHGSHRTPSLQAAWNAHGAEAFAFEALEAIDPDEPSHLRDGGMKGALARWQERLGATPI